MGWCQAGEANPRAGEEKRGEVWRSVKCARGEDTGNSRNGEGTGTREPPRRDVLELLGAKMPKYSILADKLILPMGYLYPVGNYPWVWVIWLPVPIRVWVAIFFFKTRGYYP